MPDDVDAPNVNKALKIICGKQWDSMFEMVLNIETIYNLNLLKNISFVGRNNGFSYTVVEGTLEILLTVWQQNQKPSGVHKNK